MSAPRHRVLIAGGGIAAAELTIALRDLAKDRVAIELLAPSRELVYRPLAVAEPFGLGRTHRFDLDAIADEHGARRRAGKLAEVDAARRLVSTTAGGKIEYDSLAITVGARTHEAVPGALTLAGPDSFSEFGLLLRRLGAHGRETVVFAVPDGVTWPLPLYELALMTSWWLEANDRPGVDLAVVTPESRPLGVFGDRASDGVRALLDERRVALHTSTSPSAADDGRLEVLGGQPVRADHVVALGTLSGPGIPGVPSDSDGFIPIDDHCAVTGCDAIWAAGDATAFPVKQGGIATQQADAVAEAIAASAGAPVEPKPFDPVLRGLLLTGSVPAYLSNELAPGREDTSELDVEPLWWPPSKVAGTHVGHYLTRLAATTRPDEPFGLRVETDDLTPYLQDQPAG